MEWSKLKNIIILILLLVNLFLLAMVLVQERGSAQYQEQALEDAVEVLERGGIKLTLAELPKELSLRAMALTRDREEESALAAVLLGESAAADLGSGRYAYKSALGEAEFRSNGSFSFTFTPDGRRTAAEGGEAAHAASVLEELGFTGALVSREEEGGRTLLTLRQLWQGTPVYSCQVTLTYEEGQLLSLAGQRLMGVPQSDLEESAPISAATALLRFLTGINELGDICSEITAMTPGYLLTTSTDAAQLIPIWHVTTDAGAYTLNALTGALARA